MGIIFFAAQGPVHSEPQAPPPQLVFSEGTKETNLISSSRRKGGQDPLSPPTAGGTTNASVQPAAPELCAPRAFPPGAMAQCLLLLASLLLLAAPGHCVHIETLNIFKKSPSNASASALKKTSWPRDCSEVPDGSSSGVYIIQPSGLHPIMVYCEMGGDGGWTVIQRNRQDTDITWNESWSTYKHGFGNVHTEYWLGTENIHQITRQKVYQVRFVIWDASNNKRFADYNLFSLDDESQGYRLRLGVHSGTAEDAMDSDNPRKVHNNMKFSTKDRDQDTYRGNCASRYGGGWWYSACYSVRLNVKGSITWGRLCKGNCKASAILIKPAPYH
ncbi:PREDICTED: fibrinogen-like protein 1-like protein isoform X4 [Lepidothrix coronata]|uniref:Fibrinogen-like protein 1-like protein isoform X4 n=1 Tax=Lepidothrix coronata TaxID=321398 RepID=A0A6J0J994_9PASS|nr:PREDICTED: fibrinogen-like protein 1-like protein isoform X4 [Lepidothrix coronata]